jgi:hypothetical protein
MYVSTIHKGYLYVSCTVKKNLHIPFRGLPLQRPPAIRNSTENISMFNTALLFCSHPRNVFPFTFFTVGSLLIAIGKCLTKTNSQDSAKTRTTITMPELLSFQSYACPVHRPLVICVAQYSKTSLLLYPQTEYLYTRQYAEYAQGTLSFVKGWNERNKKENIPLHL